MLKKGDKITICALCLKPMTEERAKQDPWPCNVKGHVIVTMVCEEAPDPSVYLRQSHGMVR
jgi:hypothetical protein